MEFKDALETMLAAVCNKDWEKFKGFLDPKFPVTAVLPPDRLIEGNDAFIKSQEDYFSNRTGKFSYNLLQVESSGDLGVGAIKAVYQDVANGQPFKKTIYITTVMKSHQGRWVLILDQNTVLEEQ
jgi:ketosteroid isomerase-like protein